MNNFEHQSVSVSNSKVDRHITSYKTRQIKIQLYQWSRSLLHYNTYLSSTVKMGQKFDWE